MIRFKPMPWLTLATLLSLALLITLGQWQWSRMREKEALIETLAIARAAKPEPIEAALAAPEEYARVRVPALHAASVATWGREGRVFQAAPLPDGGAILVETARGEAGPAQRQFGPFEGVLRRISRDGPANAPDRGEYLRPDPDMGPALGVAPRPDWYVALDQIEDRTPPGGARLIANPRADPTINAVGPERHLGYALTWWGLAAGLVAVYLALHARLGRLEWRSGR